RMRMGPDSKMRAVRPPRCLFLSTGEETPKGHSVRGRLGIVEVAHGEIKTDALTRGQQAARTGLYAAALSAYPRWLAARYEGVRDETRAILDRLRGDHRSEEAHRRTPGILADLSLGWHYFLRFAVESGAIAEGEARDHHERARAGLLAMGRQQADH